jgi:hypothetical protein
MGTITNQGTNSASNQDWLNVTRHNQITLSNVQLSPTFSSNDSEPTRADFETDLRKVSRKSRTSVPISK